MKKIVKFVLILLLMIAIPLGVVFGVVVGSFALVWPISENPLALTLSQQVRYAKVKHDCYFYKTANINDISYQNVIFVIPETYFVSILDDSTLEAVKVRYKDMVGYVAPDTIREVDFIPSVIEPVGVTFDMNGKNGTQLRSLPSAAAEELCVIGKDEKGITYVASISGEVPPSGKSNVWFYAIYVPSYDPTKVFEGYVYSEQTVGLKSIEVNEEGLIEELPPPTVENEQGTEEPQDFALGNTVKIVLIIMICLPIVLIFVLLLISNHKGQNKKLEKELDDEMNKKDNKPPKKRVINLTSKAKKSRIRTVDELDGQTLERKPVFYTNFLDNSSSARPVSASLKPEFPSYEVIDDDELL